MKVVSIGENDKGTNAESVLHDDEHKVFSSGLPGQGRSVQRQAERAYPVLSARGGVPLVMRRLECRETLPKEPPDDVRESGAAKARMALAVITDVSGTRSAGQPREERRCSVCNHHNRRQCHSGYCSFSASIPDRNHYSILYRFPEPQAQRHY